MTPSTATRLDAAAAALLAVGGYAAASLRLAALSWDGSWYLFRSLQDRAPFIPHERYGTYPLLWVIVQTSRVVADPKILGVCYGLLLSMFPLGSLALCWHYLRGEDRVGLRVWPALGILLTPLPGQFCLMSEATLAAQLLWPIWAILWAGLPGAGGGVWLALLSMELFFLHPTAVLIFFLAAAFCAWRAWGGTGPGRRGWTRWAGVFGALAIGKLVFSICAATAYERGQLSGGQVIEQFRNAVFGAPLALLALTYLLGFLFLAETGSLGGRRPSARVFAASRLLVCLVMAGVGIAWASDPVAWQGLLDYRRFVLPALLPVLALACWQGDHRPTPAQSTPPATGAGRLCGVAAVFAAVMVAQSFSWGALIERFARGVSSARTEAAGPFVAADDLPWTRGTELRHWTGCPLSLLLQGHWPREMYVLDRGDISPQNVRVNPWEQIPLKDGWFELGCFRADGAGQR